MFFTIPFLFQERFLNFITEMNMKDTRYKIKRVYNSLSYNSLGTEGSGFEYTRSLNKESCVTSIKELEGFTKKLSACDIEFIYTMNLATIHSTDEFESKIPRVNKFIVELRNIGVNHITVANPLLANYISKNFGDIKIGISTMMHIDSIEKLKYMSKLFNIDYIVPCTDVNKDFNFINSVKRMYPNISLELMANEECLFTCPTKNFHYATFGQFKENGNCRGRCEEFPKCICYKIGEDDELAQLFLSKTIYPWEIEKYEAYGIDSVKLVGRDKRFELVSNQIKTYMLGSTNLEYCKDKSLLDIMNFLGNPHKVYEVKLELIRKFGPKLEYFIQNNPNCRSLCMGKCNYCYGLSKLAHGSMN